MRKRETGNHQAQYSIHLELPCTARSDIVLAGTRILNSNNCLMIIWRHSLAAIMAANSNAAGDGIAIIGGLTAFCTYFSGP